MALIFLSLFINIHTQTQVFLLRKNIVLVFYLVFAFSHGQVFSNQDQIHLGIDVGKVLSLSVNPAQTVVNLDYSTSENFLEGVTAEEDNHLQIFSNVGFVINVYAINIANIDLSSIKIKAGEATDNPLPGSAEYSSVSTETMPQTIVKCESNAIDSNIKISYIGAGDNVYLSLGKNKLYEVPLTYIILPL